METLHVVSENLPAGWERAVLDTWKMGASFRTEYDKPGDPESKDVSLMLHVRHPFAEPRIHKGFPGGLDDLEKYVMEVLYGVHDHWIAPEEGKWEYTYHERLFDYRLSGKEMFPKYIDTVKKLEKKSENNGCVTDLSKLYQTQADVLTGVYRKIDQIQSIIEKLKEAPHTRRAQAVTWQAWNDIGIGDPSCLQRMWFRCEPHTCDTCKGKGEIAHGLCFNCEGTGKVDKLNMHIHIRSNDAYKAGFMNMYAFTELQKWVADQLEIEIGEYVHIADSFHIYGSYFDEFEGFLKMTADREWEDRTWTTDFAVPMFVDGCDSLLQEIDLPSDKAAIVEQRREEHLRSML